MQIICICKNTVRAKSCKPWEVMGLSTDPKTLLKSAGLRYTAQRDLIIRIIQRQSHHLDAYQVYDTARREHPGINLSTVYRTLKSLQSCGVVEGYHFGEEHHHYEASATLKHHHAICMCCGSVVEFELPISLVASETATQLSNFRIVEANVNVRGVCGECESKEIE